MKPAFQKISVVCLCVLFTTMGFAQKWEVGGFLGGSNYMGDLTPGPFSLRETHVAFGPLARYNLNPYLSIQGHFYWGTISGDDGNQRAQGLQRRGLNFRSRIWELGIQAEYNIFGFYCGMTEWTPYLFGGVGLFHFNPKGYLNGSYRPLVLWNATTNEEVTFRRYQVGIPFGAGLKYNFMESWNLGIEIGFRKTFTDYLDSFSSHQADQDRRNPALNQLGETLTNVYNTDVVVNPITVADPSGEQDVGKLDWYIFAGVTLTYTFGCKSAASKMKAKESAQQACFDFGK